MDQRSTSRMYAAMGLALQVGCLAVVIAVGSLLLGLWLDEQFASKPRLTLICVVLSVPVNLFVVLRVTQLLVARIIPPDKPKAGRPSGEPSNNEDLE